MTNRHFPFKKYMNILTHFPGSFKNVNCISDLDTILEESNYLSGWFLEAPKFTTIRINTLAISPEEVQQIIETGLREESEKCCQTSTLIYTHPVLTDCLVIGPWYDQDVKNDFSNCEVIVDAACGAAVLRGADVFAPGIMGIPKTVSEGDVVDVFADTDGKCLRGLLVKYNEGGKVFIGTGVAKMTRKELFEGDSHPNGIAVEMIQRISRVPRISLPIQYGLLQNLPSILCCHVLNPQPGQRALDMCAAPGNKTTHLATLMENTGEIIALDKTQKKIDRIVSLCECLEISCVKAYVCDSTKCTQGDIEEEKRSTHPFFTPSSFDSVLLDAPCSGLGQRPQLLNNITVKQLKSYPPLQKKLFRSATSLLKTGGNLVYSTCTMTMAENEDIVQWALKEFPELQLLPAEPILGNPGSSQNGLNEEACQLVQRFAPPFGETPETDTIGFFIAKFVKV